MSSSFTFRRYVAVSIITIFITATTAAYAQKSTGPKPAPLPPPIIAPVDMPYPGTISLNVDATNVSDRIFNVHETIPVKGREVTLLYPLWMPGTHSPSNAVLNLAGLVITANGTRLPWVRDRVEMSAFHVALPAGTTSLDVNFQYLAPTNPKRGRISLTFADLTWQTVLLYPQGTSRATSSSRLR